MLPKLVKRFKLILGKEEASVRSGSVLYKGPPHTVVCSYSEFCISQEIIPFLGWQLIKYT